MKYDAGDKNYCFMDENTSIFGRYKTCLDEISPLFKNMKDLTLRGTLTSSHVIHTTLTYFYDAQ